MKRNSKALILFLAAALLAGCANNSAGAGKNDANRGNSVAEASGAAGAKASSNLKPVEGATIGSMSSYVEDREVWKDFVDEKYAGSAKRSARGIHVPRILLDSEDAAGANKQIDDMVNAMKATYAKYENEIEGFDTGIYAAFSAYQDEDVLSVMIETYDLWEQGPAHYTVFNFSLPDGKFIDDDVLMKHFGVAKGELLGLIENSLVEAQAKETSIYYRDSTDSSYFYNPNHYTGLVLNNLWDKGKAPDQRIYIDEVGAPMFVCAQSIDPDAGLCPSLLKLRADKFDADPISDVYVRMARKLDVDPADENHKAFIIHLGAAFDEGSLKETLAKLHAWTGVHQLGRSEHAYFRERERGRRTALPQRRGMLPGDSQVQERLCLPQGTCGFRGRKAEGSGQSLLGYPWNHRHHLYLPKHQRYRPKRQDHHSLQRRYHGIFSLHQLEGRKHDAPR